MLSEDQKRALNMIQCNSGTHALLGGAGTGKSYLIESLRVRAAVTASTGIAAQNVRGTTLHSFLGITPYSKNANKEHVEKRLAGCSSLIVDEISMVNLPLFEMLMRTCYRMTKIILIGDFLQLPPVEGGWAFKSAFWEKYVQVHRLTTQHRQHEGDFIEALDDLRVGNRSTLLTRLIAERKNRKK